MALVFKYPYLLQTLRISCLILCHKQMRPDFQTKFIFSFIKILCCMLLSNQLNMQQLHTRATVKTKQLVNQVFRGKITVIERIS